MGTTGYLRPKLTDKQATLIYNELQRVIEMHVPPSQIGRRNMLERGCQAILAAEELRAWRQAFAERQRREQPPARRRRWFRRAG